MIIVVMGVCGSGKSTIGAALAAALGLPFLEGDSLHSRSNRDKMASGRPLDDADRMPWLAALAARLAEARSGPGLVIACSALKESYRRILTGTGPAPIFVHLSPDPGLILSRLEQRRGHFMPATLLDSQRSILEPPAEAIVIDNSVEPDRVVADVIRMLAARGLFLRTG